MADEVYRPQREPINPNEISKEDNQATLNKMAAFREQIAQTEQAATEEGVKFSGNLPPQLQQMLSQKNAPQINRPPMSDGSFVDKSGKLAEAISRINIVYTEITLPSLGKFYNGADGPTDGVLHIRPMTGQEEQIFGTPRLIKKNQGLDMILNQCIQEGNRYNVSNFLAIDRTFLLIYLRGISYSREYEVEIKCPACERRFNEVIDLDSLIVENCPEDLNAENLVCTLPDSGFKVHYKLLRGVDEVKIREHQERKNKEFSATGVDDTFSYQLSLAIVECAELTDPVELNVLLKRLKIVDTNYLRNVILKPAFGVDTKVDVMCSYCNENIEMELPFDASFFFPKVRTKT